VDAYGVEDEGEEEEPLVEVGFPPAVADRALAAIVAFGTRRVRRRPGASGPWRCWPAARRTRALAVRPRPPPAPTRPRPRLPTPIKQASRVRTMVAHAPTKSCCLI